MYIHTLHIVDTVKAGHVMKSQGLPYILNGYFITFTKSVSTSLYNFGTLYFTSGY